MYYIVLSLHQLPETLQVPRSSSTDTPVTTSTTITTTTIEVASVINRKGLARAGSWFMTGLFIQIYPPAIDTLVTGMATASKN